MAETSKFRPKEQYSSKGRKFTENLAESFGRKPFESHTKFPGPVLSNQFPFSPLFWGKGCVT